MTPERRNVLVRERVEGIDTALIQIGLGRDAKAAAETIRAHLIDLLGLLDRNSGLDAAADDLHRSVQSVVEAGTSGRVEDRQARLLGEAHSRFRNRLQAAAANVIPENGGGNLGDGEA